MTNDALLQAAITAARAGDLEEATNYLRDWLGKSHLLNRAGLAWDFAVLIKTA